MSPGRGHLLHGSYEADGPSEGVRVKLSSGLGKARGAKRLGACARSCTVARPRPGSLASRRGQAQVAAGAGRWLKRRSIAFASRARQRRARWRLGPGGA